LTKQARLNKLNINESVEKRCVVAETFEQLAVGGGDKKKDKSCPFIFD
jgi:hypothetical protein